MIDTGRFQELVWVLLLFRQLGSKVNAVIYHSAHWLGVSRVWNRRAGRDDDLGPSEKCS